jgi:hypothetical protein
MRAHAAWLNTLPEAKGVRANHSINASAATRVCVAMGTRVGPDAASNFIVKNNLLSCGGAVGLYRIADSCPGAHLFSLQPLKQCGAHMHVSPQFHPVLHLATPAMNAHTMSHRTDSAWQLVDDTVPVDAW